MHSLFVGKCAFYKRLMDQSAIVAVGHHRQAFSGIQGEPKHGAEATAHAEVADKADIVTKTPRPAPPSPGFTIWYAIG